MNTIIIFIISMFIFNSLSIVKSFVAMGRVAVRPAHSHVKVRNQITINKNKDNRMTNEAMKNNTMINDTMTNEETNNNNDNSLLILFYAIISILIGNCLIDYYHDFVK